MKDERLSALRAQRQLLLFQLALLDTAIAAEGATSAFKMLDDRLTEALDDMCQANAACEMTVADLRALPAAPEPGLGLN